MYDQLKAVVDASGIWRGHQIQSHGFRLSPSVFTISKAQQHELQELGIALRACLLGLSHIAVIAYDQSLNYTGPWRIFRKVFSTGVPKIYQELQGMNIKHIPQLLKVDLMVDTEGNFKIAEVDGHNKHGLGYSTLGKRFRQAIMPTAQALPGAVKLLAAEIQRCERSELKLFYGEQERFYLPEFQVAIQEFEREGVKVELIPESYYSGPKLTSGLLLDLPFLYRHPSLYLEVIEAYRRCQIEFVIPPKPCLGAKGVLALLRNDGQDVGIESVLNAFIDAKSLALVRQYIPPTYLVGQMATSVAQAQALVAEDRYVLKESISSGMKGTIFSDEPDFTSTLQQASKSNLNWILQSEVTNQPQTFSWYEAGNNGVPELRTSSDWFMRVTVQYVRHQMADIIVTARQDKAVHGAKDCIQLGSVVV